MKLCASCKAPLSPERSNSYCLPCSREKHRAWKALNREHLAIRQREWRAANPAYDGEYKSRPEVRPTILMKQRLRTVARLQDPLERMMADARLLTNRAIKDGRLVRQPCEKCQTTEKVEAHHDDYGRPLDVRWFCSKHHKELHRQWQTTEDAKAKDRWECK